MIKRALKTCLLVALMLAYHLVNGEDKNEHVKWKGKSELEKGVKVMRNPGDPLFGEIGLQLEEDLYIAFGQDENDFFQWVSTIELDAQNCIYLLDSSKCVIYKFDHQGKYIYKMGRKGEGPGEFRRPMDIFVDKDGFIWVLDYRIIHKLDNKGNYKDQIKLNQDATHFFINPMGEIIMGFRGYSGINKERVVALFTPHLEMKEKIASFFDGVQVRREIDGKRVTFFVTNYYTPELFFQRSLDGRCVFAYSTDYTLHVLDAKGKYLMKIKKEEQDQPISDQEKKTIYDYYAPYYEKKWPKKLLHEALQYPEHRPFLKCIKVDDKGRIYVARLESVLKRLAESNKDKPVPHDVFNIEGYYLYQMKIPVLPDLIRNGYIYYIDENSESGNIGVKRFAIKNWQQLKI